MAVLRLIYGNFPHPTIFGICRFIDDDDDNISQVTEKWLFGNQESKAATRALWSRTFRQGLAGRAWHQKKCSLLKCVQEAKEGIARRWQDSNLRPRRELISSQSH